VNTDKQSSLLSASPQPACNSPPGDPVVSSTETSFTPSSSILPRLSSSDNITVIEYDESDSDEEDEGSDLQSTGDSLPSSSSSVGQSTSNLSSSQSSSDDQDDVSSTSGDHEPFPASVDDMNNDEASITFHMIETKVLTYLFTVEVASIFCHRKFG
ncbi:unnamed protein product, partial [Thelazia callipaeda]|uniref:DMP1 n=1 Tax=Thelazia callipaeda TaxID=103827 RepID=A0A0N5CXR7_THECL